jgi:hypothetical protein
VSTEIRNRVKRFVLRVIGIGLASLLTVTAVAYAADYCVFRYRVAANRQPFSQITVSRYYAVPQKNGKTQFIFDPPAPQTCVNSLFPRAGYVPCWYLQRHAEPRVNM